MTPTPEQEKKLFIVLAAALAVLVLYRVATSEKQRTAPLAFPKGSVATSPIRGGVSAAADGTGPLAIFIERRNEKFPGVARDIFRMADYVPKPKPVIHAPVNPPPPPVPEKTPEEIAKENARADLSRFRFLGYLTDKDSSLFLSRDGELFIVKSGERVLKNYIVKETGKDYVILLDSATNVDARIELSGSGPERMSPRPR